MPPTAPDVTDLPDRYRTRRGLLIALTLLSGAAGAGGFGTLLWRDAATDLLDWPLLAVFTLLFLFVAFSFWMATLGFFDCLRDAPAPLPGEAEGGAGAEGGHEPLHDPPRVAVLMPIYNEDPTSVFAGLRAIGESLVAADSGAARRVDLFVLSDTTQPDVWLEEELAWARLRDVLAGEAGDGGEGSEGGVGEVFYRRRPKNVRRKSGNIEDFCTRWGRDYPYMIVLDADSIMDGRTLIEMIRRMEGDARLSLLQVPPVPVNMSTLFARMQQWASATYGPIFTRGLAEWTGDEGNYFGHNAIIRTEAFTQSCGLPKLPGIEPLGGEILSHDFVEAALLRRAGWKVRIAHDLGGSYEQTPASLIDFAARDRRWCQGNLQHLKLLMALGWHPVSRLHLGMGVMSFVSAPLWLLFMLLGLFEAMRDRLGWAGIDAVERSTLMDLARTPIALTLFAITMLMLLAPKLWGLLLLYFRPRRRELQGGGVRATISVAIESIIAMLVAPIMMAFHSVFVVTNLVGATVSWSAQNRGEGGTPLAVAIQAHWKHTLAGIVAGLGAWWISPGLFWWLSPILFGLVASIPLSMLVSSPMLGRWLRERGLLLIPEEADPPAVLRRHAELMAQSQRNEPATGRDRFLQVILDPSFNAMHIALLRAYGAAPSPSPQLPLVQQLALKRGPGELTREEQFAILNDEAALRWLHRQAWKLWPMDTLRSIPPLEHTRDAP